MDGPIAMPGSSYSAIVTGWPAGVALLHRRVRPGPLVWREEVDVKVHGLKQPDAVVADVAVVIRAHQPSRFLASVRPGGRRHEEAPFAGGVIVVDELDDRVEAEMGGKHDLAGDAGEIGPELLVPDMAAELLAIEGPVPGEKTGNAVRVVVVVAVLEVARLQPLDLFDRLQPRYAPHQIQVEVRHVSTSRAPAPAIAQFMKSHSPPRRHINREGHLLIQNCALTMGARRDV